MPRASRWSRRRCAQRRPGPYQLQAAIAACHADAAAASDTDWRQIAALYGELLRFDPTPVIEANRAVAVAYAEGPAAGLAILDTLAASSRLARWPQLHIARAALLARCGRREDAVAAYRDALALEPADAVRRHITGQIAALGAAPAPDRGDLMDVDAALQSQIRNIEATYGKPLDYWFAVIDASGLTKHNQVVAMLKADHGLAHGAAHRVSLLARQRHDAGVAAPTGPGRRSLRWRESRTPAAARCPPRRDPRARRLRHRPEEGLPEPSPPQAVRDGPAQHHQPDRPRADPAGHNASDRPAGVRRPNSTRYSPTVSASPQPPTLTTSSAAGSPPRTHWPG